MTDLRQVAQQALEYMKSVGQADMHPEEWAIVERLEAALVEDAMQKFTDVSQEIEAALAEPVQEPFALPCPTPKACKAHCCSGNCIPRSKA